MIKYGLISQVDAKTIEKTLSLVFREFEDETINTTEIGVFDGDTSRGINQFVINNGRKNNHTAIDSAKYFEIKKPFEDCNLIIGNSTEVAYKLKDSSQHFIFIDGSHTFPAVIADFFCYEEKIKTGGYFAFHDTSKWIAPMSAYQDVGSREDPNMYISVRRALESIGVMEDFLEGWKLVFDEADEDDEAGGICVFQKLY